MARYKKRPKIDDRLQPGLFDDLEPEALGSDGDFVATLPPEVEEERRRRSQASRPALFDGTDPDDEFTPMEAPTAIDRLQFISFGSGSSGNCTYIGDSSGGLLIDAGVEMTHVVNELRRHGVEMSQVKGILVTHDHSDHVRFVYPLVRRYRHMHVYCTLRTLNGMLRRHNISNRIKDYHRAIYKEHPFEIAGFTVTAFDVSHDGTDNCGFFLSHGRHNMAVATDLGCITERADYYMRQANYLMIEANYDERMLTLGSYPEYLKARIRSDIGHLDNVVTARYLAEIYTPALRNIFLCHLSKDNNTPEIALKAVEQALTDAGVTAVGDCSDSPYSRMAPVQLLALPRFDSTGLITLRLL